MHWNIYSTFSNSGKIPTWQYSFSNKLFLKLKLWKFFQILSTWWKIYCCCSKYELVSQCVSGLPFFPLSEFFRSSWMRKSTPIPATLMFFSLEQLMTKNQTNFFCCHFNSKIEEYSLFSFLFNLEQQQQKKLADIWCLIFGF